MPVSGSTGYRSGFLNLPPKVILRARDNVYDRLSYPRVVRTGDHDFASAYGMRLGYFDDTQTLYFGSTNDVPSYPSPLGFWCRYPQVLPVRYPWLNYTIATPNIASTLGSSALGQDVIYRGVPSSAYEDEYVFGQNGEKADILSPYEHQTTAFDDSRVYLDTTEFYLTGTAASVMPGFSSRLADKVQIVIDVNPSSPTTVFFSTGTAPNSTSVDDIGSGMAYYNFLRTRWEMIGVTRHDITTGSNVDFRSRDLSIATGSYVAFAGVQSLDAPLSSMDDLVQSSIGYPVDMCGFPFAKQFTATGSQWLKMGSYINQPFLLEKVTLEFSASFAKGGNAPASTNRRGPVCSQFFILNQFNNGVRDATEENIRSLPMTLAGTDDTIVGEDTIRFCDKFKELVWTGVVSRYNDSANSARASRDLDIVTPAPASSANSPIAITGSWRIEKAPSVFSSTPARVYMRPRTPVGTSAVNSFNNYNVNILGWQAGNRGGVPMVNMSGRPAVRPISGLQKSGSYITSYHTKAVTTNANSITEQASPYMLFPTDNLVLGFSNIVANDDPQGHGAAFSDYSRGIIYTDETLRKVEASLLPGAGKLTLFGSILRDNKPIDVSTNPSLSSDALHEITHQVITDQFQVEPTEEYKSAYIDRIFGGSMFSTTDPRRILGQPTEGTQGITGSLLRAVKMPTENERYMDSLMPSMVSYFNNCITSVSGTVFSPMTTMALSNVSYRNLSQKAIYLTGAMSANMTEVFLNADAAVGFPYVGNPPRVLSETVPLVVSGSNNDIAIGTTTNYDDIKDVLFSINRQHHLIGVESIPNGATTSMAEANRGNAVTVDGQVRVRKFTDLRAASGGTATGFRYGIASNRPLNSEAVYRYDRFGMIRDMLKQRCDTAFFDTSNSSMDRAAEPPIKCLFVNYAGRPVDPLSTQSQNLSKFCTSSLPYFDGELVDRSLAPTLNEITIYEVSELGG